MTAFDEGALFSPSADEIARQVLTLVFQFRRLGSPDDPCATPCPQCYAVHLNRMVPFIERVEPVHFVLPAFPAKSRNPNKVVGSLPDLGERISIEFLQSFCEQVSHFHQPGAQILICSDGHVFSDVLGIPDDDVSTYRDELELMISATGGASVQMYSLEDAFGIESYDDMRELLTDRYAIPLDQIRGQVREDIVERSLFNGMHRFMVEDEAPQRPDFSKTKIRELAKDLAYRMIQRSKAWGELVNDKFPNSLRLSIHPQPSHAEKIGFHLIRTKDSWLTPWHGVVVDDGKSMTLVKRSQAEEYNASLVWRNGRPSHFVNPNLPPEEKAS